MKKEKTEKIKEVKEPPPKIEIGVKAFPENKKDE